MFKWNATLYNQFAKERIQPSIDLIHRLPEGSYNRILDVGCGSGMSTVALRSQFPQAKIAGVDLSEQMLEKAKELEIDVEWIQRDCSKTLEDLGQFDLVFSNAFLQWLPHQETFLAQTKAILAKDGILAMQVPNWEQMPIKDCIDEVVEQFEEFKEPIALNAHNYSMNHYYDMLVKQYQAVEIWQTNYTHIMEDYHAIIDFIKGAGIRPYLQRLDEVRQETFIKEFEKRLPKIYPIQADGKVLFIFKRILFIAK
ncbi:MAG: methyltransferase domain-containing protein [Cellulosilyticum sp.]|nr:methyltransferase domain-containing protein [Cellulosilyticum sp.]